MACVHVCERKGKTPPEIYCMYLDNKVIYCIFKMLCIISVLFCTKCCLFQNYSLFYPNNAFFIHHAWKFKYQSGCLKVTILNNSAIKLMVLSHSHLHTCNHLPVKSHSVFCFCLRPLFISWYSIQPSLSEPFQVCGSQIFALLCIPHLFVWYLSLTWNSWSCFVFLTRAMNTEEVSSAL
jgi:hypothetical protein